MERAVASIKFASGSNSLRLDKILAIVGNLLPETLSRDQHSCAYFGQCKRKWLVVSLGWITFNFIVIHNVPTTQCNKDIVLQYWYRRSAYSGAKTVLLNVNGYTTF